MTLQKYFILSTLICTTAFSQQLSLDDAIRYALEKNDKIGQYRERLQQKQQDNSAAYGNFAPSVTLTGSYTHLNDPLTIDLDPIRQAIISLQTSDAVSLTNLSNIISTGAPLTDAQKAAVGSAAQSKLNALLPPFSEVLKKQDYKTATLVGVQPLFTGGKLLAAKAYASDEEEAATAELTRLQQEITHSVTTQYLNVVLLNNVIQTRKEVLDGMKKHKAQAEKLVAQGLIANYQLLRAEVAVAEAENNLFDDQNKLQLAFLALRSTMGFDESYPIQVSDQLLYKEMVADVEAFQSTANDQQPLLHIVAAKKDAAHQKFVAERAEFLPQIAAFGKYEMYPQYLSALEPRWAVGIQLQIPLFSGLKRYFKMESAVHLEQELDYIDYDVKKTIRLWVNKTYLTTRNAREKYTKLQTNEELAAENLRLNEKRFETGLTTSLEVIDAQLSMEKVKIDRSKTLMEYYQALSELSYATGDAHYMISLWNSAQQR